MSVFRSAGLPAITGLAAGTLAVLLLQSRQTAPPETPSAVHPETPRGVAPAVTVAVPVYEASQAVASALPQPSAGSIAAAPAGTPERPDRAAAHAAELEDERLIKAHLAGVRDPGWANGTVSAIYSDLKGAPVSNHLQVEQVDCRTSTCILKLSWPSYTLAAQDQSAVVQSLKSAPCSRRLTLPNPEPEAGRYQATVVMDCPDRWAH